MYIVVKATPQQQKAFLTKEVPPGVRVDFISGNDFAADADAYFDLCYEEDGAAFQSITQQPVFVNAVVDTLQRFPQNFARINAWDGFLERTTLEVVLGKGSQATAVQKVMDALNWKFQPAPDVPGMIAARVIAMIVNEAYFGLGDGISTKKDIDTAMKLGTNYPHGPFEWGEKIGLKKIGVLLQALSQTDSRYKPAPALQQEIE